nr:MAG TPA: hypothetical protein [Caudoviricetes sp.]
MICIKDYNIIQPSQNLKTCIFEFFKSTSN